MIMVVSQHFFLRALVCVCVCVCAHLELLVRGRFTVWISPADENEHKREQRQKRKKRKFVLAARCACGTASGLNVVRSAGPFFARNPRLSTLPFVGKMKMQPGYERSGTKRLVFG